MTKNDIIKMAREAGLQPYYDEQESDITAFANLVANHEREECAKVAREIGNATNPDDWALDKCGEIEAAIRARGENT
jgi:hypothetical protein